MLTATHLVILATVVSLAHNSVVSGQVGDKGKYEPITLHADCCTANKATPTLFKPESHNCFDSDSDTPAAKEKEMCMVQCVLGANGMLNGDKSIKEKELKALFVEKVDPEARTFVQAAFEKCFEHHSKNPDVGSPCESGAEYLFGCITSEVIMNCPDSMWLSDMAQCKGAREELKRAVAAAEKGN